MNLPAMLPLTIIGGYLGAGKTTLVNHLLRHADGMRIAVLVNEFGTLPIDEDLIEAQDDAVISIAGGCVCCSYGNDLIKALMDLSQLDPAPDHVLLESSGVALPGAIAASVSLLTGFQLEGIVVLADAETISQQTVDPYVGDTVEQQLKDADILMLNKCDLVGQNALDATLAMLGVKTNGAEIVQTRHCDVPRDVALQAFLTVKDARARMTDHKIGTFETRFMAVDFPVHAQTVAKRLSDVSLSLIRAKGFVQTQDGPKTIQVVGRRWAVTDAPDGCELGIVVIALASKLDMAAVQKTLSGG